MRVMFVDDEQCVLDGIGRMLFAMDSEWELSFANSGAKALAALGAAPVDVVVSDMRMPAMDGRQLLTEVRSKWPGTLRIILSGYTEEEVALRSLDVAHQFLAKPCEGQALVAVIERMLALRALVGSDSLKRLVGRIGHLPPTPRVYLELTRCVADPASDTHAVAAVLLRDPALSARVLQVANSAFFQRGKPITDIGTAVTRVGMNTLRTLVLATEVFIGEHEDCGAAHLQRRALHAALIAEHICAGEAEVHAAMTAALLADVGLLIPGIEAHCRRAAEDGEGEYGHAEIGAYLLGLWGLPAPIVEAVAHHADPRRIDAGAFGLAGVAHVANSLACGAEPLFDYLARTGRIDRYPDWRRFAQTLAERAS